MKLRTYKTTGTLVALAMKLLGVDLRISGLEALPERPILFVANHFTRFETFLVPYVLFRRFDRPVCTLATHTIFKGPFARYLAALGVISIRDPKRNRTIIGGLMTGRADWVIYPEGGLVKNKKTVEGGRLHLRKESRQGPPHTGAALMALKSELLKRRYRAACASGDQTRRAYYEDRFDLDGPGELSPVATLVIPINITYPRLRSGRNILHRAAAIARRGLHPHMDEELKVEGTLLFGDPEISVHLGEPIEVADYLDHSTDLARRMIGWFRKSRRDDLFLRRPARRLTSASMRSVYESTEINFDHLFCYGLRATKDRTVPVRRFRKALYLAALGLRGCEGLRLHPALRNGIVALTTGDRFEPLEDIEALARREGVLDRADEEYVIDHDALDQGHDFHDIRLRHMVQVIANELEPIEPAVRIVREAVNLSEVDLADHLSHAMHDADQTRFRRDYDRWHDPERSTRAEFGEPFFLEAKDPKAGVVLAHGYLACPEQMRPLADYLCARGFSVYGVRLQGHGTAPDHLTEVSWQGWMDCLMRAFTLVRHRCPRTAVGGFSLGGILATHLAANVGDELDALFTINAPLRLRHRFAPLVPAVFHINRAMRSMRSPRDLSRIDNDSESPDTNYDTDYLGSVRELRRAISSCRKRLRDVTAPALILQTEDDPVVVPRSADLFDRGLESTVSLVTRLPGDRHIVVRGEDAQIVFEEVHGFLERVLTADAPT